MLNLILLSLVSGYIIILQLSLRLIILVPPNHQPLILSKIFHSGQDRKIKLLLEPYHNIHNHINFGMLQVRQ